MTALFRRFDHSLMQAPAASAGVEPTLLAPLRNWCDAGAFPRLSEPLAVATIAPHAGLDGVAGVMDGSHALARLARWRGLAWRVQIVLAELRPGRTAQQRRQTPWDCGWWRDGAYGPAAAFRPRRATLLLVREPPPRAVQALLTTLAAQQSHYTRPLRVLLVCAQAAPDLHRIELDAGPVEPVRGESAEPTGGDVARTIAQ